MYEDARAFLTKVLPWPFHEPAYLNIHTKQPDREGLPGRGFQDLDAAIGFVDWQKKDGRDVYVCMSLQRDAMPRKDKNGRDFYTACRHSKTAVALKTLFFELDCKFYDDDHKTTWAAFQEWRKKVGLPDPTVVVNSGNGLHVYWTLDRALGRDQWSILAHALEEAGKRHGLKFDKGVNSDASRVLRVPETLNFKSDPPKEVKLFWLNQQVDYKVEDMETILGPYVMEIPQGQVRLTDLFEDPPLDGPRTPLPSELAAGIQTESAMPQDEIRQCIDLIPNPSGNGWSEWNHMGMVIWAACQGEEYGLEEWEHWSKKHPAYGIDEKDSCTARWKAYEGSPPDNLSAGSLIYMARQAKGDPKWMPVRAALPARVMTAKSVEDLPEGWDLPDGYSRGPDGTISVAEPDKKGNVQLYDVFKQVPLLDPRLQRDPWLLYFTTRNPVTGERVISLPCENLTGDALRTALGRQGLSVQMYEGVRLSEFLVNWQRKLQQIKAAMVSSAPYGWTLDDNGQIEGFSYAGKVYLAGGGERHAPPADPITARQYNPKGDPSVWREAMKIMCDQKRPTINAILATAFGGPLVRFTGHPGLFLAAWSGGGNGKTTAIKVAQGVWAQPFKSVPGQDDTNNWLFKRLGEIASLPIYWDELKTEQDMMKFIKAVFQLTHGNEKNRLKSDTSVREGGSWQTLLVSCSNNTLMDMIAAGTRGNDAGIMRCFEYEVHDERSGNTSNSYVTRLISNLASNYGHVGIEYSKWLGQNHQRCNDEMGEYLEDLEKEIAPKDDERFWKSTLASVMMGAKYANELGFMDIDEGALKDFMLEKLQQLRDYRQTSSTTLKKEINISEVMSQFLGDAQVRHMVRTDKVHRGSGRPPAGAVAVYNDITKVESIWVHCVKDDNLLRISSVNFGRWCHERKLARTAIIEELIRQFSARVVQGRLASGSGRATTLEHIIEIDATNNVFTDFVHGH